MSTIKLFKTQMAFMRSTKPIVAYSGGFGSGKSHILAWKAIEKAVKYPNNFILMCRKTKASMINSTIKTLKDLINEHLPDTVEYIDSKSLINFPNGSQIYYQGFDHDMSIRSLNCGSIFVDEGIEVNQLEWETLESRLRNKADPYRQIFCATNPSGKNHYLYNKFFNNPNADTFCANSFENKYLPEDYLNRLKTLPDFEYRRNVLGEWISPEGLCVPEFKRDIHVNAFVHSSYDSYVIGIDFGFTDPTCIVVAGLKGNQAFIIDELSMSNILNRDIISFLEKYRSVNPKIVVDPSAANFIAELQANHFNVEKATNSVQIGLMTLNDAFKSGYITINNDCKNLINSLELYSYKLNSEIPDHKYSDICDATRYLIMYLKGNPIIKPSIYIPSDDDLNDKDDDLGIDDDDE